MNSLLLLHIFKQMQPQADVCLIMNDTVLYINTLPYGIPHNHTVTDDVPRGYWTGKQLQKGTEKVSES